jgi:hypothetical protein
MHIIRVTTVKQKISIAEIHLRFQGCVPVYQMVVYKSMDDCINELLQERYPLPIV